MRINKMPVAVILIIFLALRVKAHGNVAFQELVCQHCNALYGPDDEISHGTPVGEAGPVGMPCPKGPSGEINETTIRQIFREEIEIMLQELKNESKLEVSDGNTKQTPVRSDNDWTVFQRRMDGSVNFYRGWNDYVNGFGYGDGEFWLGLERIRQLTKFGDMELQIDMIEKNGTHLTAQYSYFEIGPASDKYRIRLSGYSGNATDSFGRFQNNMLFTTKDSDNDKSRDNCGVLYTGGWWFKYCNNNLNGIFDRTDHKGIRWFDHSARRYMTLRFTEMKVRLRS